MNVHVTEQQKQHAQHVERQARLGFSFKRPGSAIAFQPAALPSDNNIDFFKKRIAYLEATLKQADDKIAETEEKARSRIAKEQEICNKRIELMELDLADAQARILSQAKIITQFDSVEVEEEPKRPVPVIIAEVLAGFEGVTWADIISARRDRRLIKPRHACMKAVYDERKDLSSPTLGRIFKRDHSSILHAVKK